MKLFTTLAVAASALAVGASTAAAKFGPAAPPAAVGPDAVDRYVANRNAAIGRDAVDRYVANRNVAIGPDALDRYVLNELRSGGATRMTGAAGHPDSRAERPGLAPASASISVDGRDWGTGLVGALGGALLAILAVVGASAIRGRRRLVLR